MKNLAFKKDKIQDSVPELTLVEVMNSEEQQKNLRWFKGLIKSFSIKNDMSLETFERIESKKIACSKYNYFY